MLNAPSSCPDRPFSSALRLSCALFAAVLALAACDEGDPDESDAAEVPEVSKRSGWSQLNTNVAPTELGLYAHGANNGGTSGAVTLSYVNQSGTYSCSIGSIGNGKTKTCTPTKTSTATTVSGTYDKFYAKIGETNDDGLRISLVRVTLSGAIYTLDDFNSNPGTGLYCEGCFAGGVGTTDCNSCWLDAWGSNGGNTCIEIKIPMNTSADSSCTAESDYY